MKSGDASTNRSPYTTDSETKTGSVSELSGFSYRFAFLAELTKVTQKRDFWFLHAPGWQKIDQQYDQGGSVFCKSWRGLLAGGLLVLGLWDATIVPNARAQGSSARQVKSKVEPAYPELARRMRIAGVVKVKITIAPVGTVTGAKIIGGHPVLANAVLDAVKKWRYEASRQETTESLEFRFDPNQ